VATYREVDGCNYVVFNSWLPSPTITWTALYDLKGALSPRVHHTSSAHDYTTPLVRTTTPHPSCTRPPRTTCTPCASTHAPHWRASQNAGSNGATIQQKDSSVMFWRSFECFVKGVVASSRSDHAHERPEAAITCCYRQTQARAVVCVHFAPICSICAWHELLVCRAWVGWAGSAEP
jgi:hypothetical protein